MNKLSPYKRFEALSDEEKEAVYQECEELDIEDARPLSPELRRLERIARRRRGRPRLGRGARRLNVTIERGLLAKADALARRQHVTRSELIARGLRAVLAGAA